MLMFLWRHLSPKWYLLTMVLGLLITGCVLPAAVATPTPNQVVASMVQPQSATPLNTSMPTTHGAVPVSVMPTITPWVPNWPDSQERWIQDLLDGHPCTAPCWQQIIPGQTTRATAVTIIKTLPNAIMHEYPDSPDIQLNLPLEQPIGDIGEITFVATAPYTTTLIRLISSLRLERLLTAYGKPPYVIAHAYNAPPDGGYTSELWFLYPEQGIVFGTVQAGKPQLDPQFRITTILLFEPQHLDYWYITQDLARGAKMVPWQGYQSFAFYCTSTEQPNWCER